MDRVRPNVCGVWHHQRDGDFDRPIIDPALDPCGRQRDGGAGAETNGDKIREAQQACFEGRRHSSDHQRDAELEGQQSGRIIHQALAFEQIDDPPRESESTPPQYSVKMSSGKQYSQRSPGSADAITGWPLVRACLRA